MRIAMMTNNYKPFIGGVPLSVECLSEGLKKQGHEVKIFAPEYKEYGEPEKDVIRYHSYTHRMKNGMAIPDVLDGRIIEAFEKEDYDVIHVHHPMLIGNIAQYLSRRYNIPLVYTYHTKYEEYLHYLPPFGKLKEQGAVGTYLYQKSQKILPKFVKAFVNQCDLIYAPSSDIQQYLYNQDVTTPIQQLPTGLFSHAYEEHDRHTENIRFQYLEEGQYLFCTVSRLEKEKNLHFLLESVAKLKKRQGIDFRFLMIGDGSLKEELQAYAKELDIADEVIFTGAVPNRQVKDYLFASDMFLFASHTETQGIVLAEAMAAGTPVAALPATGVNDILEDEYNGCLTEEDTEQYAVKVATVIADEKKMQELKTGARQTANRYHMDQIAARAVMGYERVLEERREKLYGVADYEKEHFKSSFLRLFKVS